MLSSAVGHGAPAQTRVQERREESDNERSSNSEQLFKLKQRRKGKKRATIEDTSNSELLSMLKDMREDLEERDEKIREELRLRDEHLEDQINKREDALTTALKQR